MAVGAGLCASGGVVEDACGFDLLMWGRSGPIRRVTARRLLGRGRGSHDAQWQAGSCVALPGVVALPGMYLPCQGGPREARNENSAGFTRFLQLCWLCLFCCRWATWWMWRGRPLARASRVGPAAASCALSLQQQPWG